MSTTEDRHEAELQVYELGYLILPSIPEENLSSAVDSMKNVITSRGGTMLDSEDPFKRKLAYRMYKAVGVSRYMVNEAYIGWMKFEIQPGEVEAVKGEVESMDEVLRSLLIKAPRETAFTFASTRKEAEEEIPAEEDQDTEGESEDDEEVESDDDNDSGDSEEVVQ